MWYFVFAHEQDSQFKKDLLVMTLSSLCLTCSQVSQLFSPTMTPVLLDKLTDRTHSITESMRLVLKCLLSSLASSSRLQLQALRPLQVWSVSSQGERAWARTEEREILSFSSNKAGSRLFTTRCSASFFSLCVPGQEWESVLYLTCALSLC